MPKPRRRPKVTVKVPNLTSRKSTAKVVAGAAKEIGKAGYKVGELVSEVRKVREAVSQD